MSVLPEIAGSVDLAHLSLVPGSHVNAELAERHTDLLFRAPLRADPRTHCHIYFGSRATRMHEIIAGLEDVPELAKYVPDFELCLDALAFQDDEALKRRPLKAFPKVALWLLRDSRDVELLLDHMAAWGRELDALVREDPKLQDAATVSHYLLRVAGEVPAQAVQARVAEVAPLLEVPMASAAEQLIQQGLETGRQQGRQEAVKRAVATRSAKPSSASFARAWARSTR